MAYAVDVANASPSSVIKADGLVCKGNTFFQLGSRSGGTTTYIVGAGGFTVSGNGYFHGGACPFEIYPTADFNFGPGGYNHSSGKLISYLNNNTMTFHTSDYETSEGRTITIIGAVHGEYDCCINVDGSGVLVVNDQVTATGTMNVSGTATVAVNAGKTLLKLYSGQGRRLTMGAGTTLKVAESGTVTMGARAFTLNANAALAFNFTEREVAPVLSMPSATANYNGMSLPNTVNVKISASNGVTPKRGTYTLTSGEAFKFTGKAINLVDPPIWVKSVDVVEGNLVLTVRPMGLMVIVR